MPLTMLLPSGVSATHGSDASMSKKIAPVSRTARNTSDNASMQFGRSATSRGRAVILARAGARYSRRHSTRRMHMPLFMDIHEHIEGLTADAVTHAHEADLKTQDKYDVKILRYWFDEGNGKVFCLIEAPSKEAAAAVHREAHGLVADQIIEVTEGK